MIGQDDSFLFVELIEIPGIVATLFGMIWPRMGTIADHHMRQNWQKPGALAPEPPISSIALVEQWLPAIFLRHKI
jgi:hypothetical protein